VTFAFRPCPAQLIRSLLDKGVKNGFTVLRAWAHAVNPEYALETSPGQYNEAVFRVRHPLASRADQADCGAARV
jgi:mannan endo-1,4-beta-mannosidase